MKTYITTRQPWGIVPRCGHRLLCADGVIRAAQLAPTPDTYFSHPASVRYKGKHVSGYMTTDTPSGLSSDTPHVYVFHPYQYKERPQPPAPLVWWTRPSVNDDQWRDAEGSGTDWTRFDAAVAKWNAEGPTHHETTIRKAL